MSFEALSWVSLTSAALRGNIMSRAFRRLFSCLFPNDDSRGQEDGIDVSKQTTVAANKDPTSKTRLPHLRLSPPSTTQRHPDSTPGDRDRSDATQTTLKPQSIGTSSKPDSDPDEIAPVLQPHQRPYVSVMDALEDRRRLFERLRNPGVATPAPPTVSTGNEAG